MNINLPELRRNSPSKELTSTDCAKEIMGNNFFGTKEFLKHITGNRTEFMDPTVPIWVPYSEDILTNKSDTHVLALVFPISILHLRQNLAIPFFNDYSWYDTEPFAAEKGRVSWHLTRKHPHPESFSKSWKEQTALLPKHEHVPPARVLVYLAIGHYLNTGERLYDKVYVRSSSCTKDGEHVRVGLFASRLSIGSYPTERFSERLGIVSSI